MGKLSKRNKVITLAKTKKKDKSLKTKTFETTQKLLQSYARVFALSLKDFKTAAFQQIREMWRDSKFVMGKTRVLQKALGKTAEDALLPNSHQLAKVRSRQWLVGSCALLFTNRSEAEVVSFFTSFSQEGFLHAGAMAPEDVIIPAGTGTFSRYSNSIEPYLRKLGLPTRLHNAEIHVLTTYTVCRTGEQLSPEQCRILKLLDRKLGEFTIIPQAVWSPDGSFRELTS